MSLDYVGLRGFKSIRILKLDLRPLNVLIGANGSGKSNFIGLFRFLTAIAEGQLQLYVRQNGGAESFLFLGSKATKEISVFLSFSKNAYRSTWLPTVDDSLVFRREDVFRRNDPNYPAEYPHGWGIGSGTGQKESQLIDEAARRNRSLERGVLQNLTGLKTYHFHDTSNSALMKKTGALNDNLELHSDARNLAGFLYGLKLNQNEHYLLIRDTVRLVAPYFDDFLLRPMTENSSNIQLEWRQQGSDFPFLAHHLSDGTLRFICLATVLLQPELPATILIDEPELGLHPYAINTLASLMRSAATRTQLIISTQSVPLVNQFEPQDLLVVDRIDDATVIRRPEPDSLTQWLEEYSLGELWEKNVLGGRPSR